MPAPSLKLSPTLSPSTRDPQAPRPTFLSADKITGQGDAIVAEGEVEVRQIGTTLNADRVTYWQDREEVEAEGNVRLVNEADTISGPKARLRLDDKIGFFEQPAYTIRRAPTQGRRFATSGSGRAERIDFEGEDQYRLKDATYSTCAPDDYDWYAETGDLQLDFTREVGEARDAKLIFKDVPIFYTPWMEFTLNNRRKSGFLPPTLGSSSRTGTDYTQPWYWNIAPDMDATFAPRIMTRRGLQLGAEFRYLGATYNGTLTGEYLPNDSTNGETRSMYAVQHAQDFGRGLTGSLNLNGVSDDTYFTDLSSRISSTSQTNLLRQGILSYSGGGWWSVVANAQSYQTLQDPAQPPIAEPYDLLPQVTLSALRPDLGGFAFTLGGQYTDFDHPTLDNGKRTILYPQIAWPLEAAGFFFTPKAGLHWTHYALDRRQSTGEESISRSVPIVSLDTGLFFDRDTDWLGAAVTQTLEPRLYYLYVPSRDQAQIPIFDTAQLDFNFAQIFAENIFSGGDRIADANQLTAALTSRLIDQSSGAELVRAALGQRYYFRDQTVTLPGVAPRTERSADILASLSGQLLPRVFLDTAWQYNPRDSRTERFVIGGRYQPGMARVLNASYRFQREVLKDVDVSGQWPFSSRWYGVGRYNYSLEDKRLVELIAGLEYKAGCWVLRGVIHRFATGAEATNTAFFLQLELNGFSSIGSNPLDLLKRTIPGYGKINPSISDPVFGEE